MHQSDIAVVFDGEYLISIGEIVDENSISTSESYNITSSARIGADYSLLRSYGNSEGSFSITVVRDFPSPSAAVAHIIEIKTKRRQSKIAPLSIGALTYNSAGIAKVSTIQGRSPSGAARVWITYDFMCSHED